MTRNTSNLHFFTNNEQYYSLIFVCSFCATPTNCSSNLQKSPKKLNLADLLSKEI